MPHYSRRFEEALLLATKLHQGQLRKGTQTPYITHLIGVAAIVGDVGGSEDQVIAALLHDAVEDQIEHNPTLPDTIREQFGEDVIAMVLACSDTSTHPKPPWQERKEAYIAHIEQADMEDPALLVSLADKTYNGYTLLRDARIHGQTIFERFKSSPEQAIWYYRTLAEAFAKKSWPTAEQRALCEDYTRLVEELAKILSSWDD
tara:strand:+ start:216 stop:824 length:609 start_codon:yes stop_codon:yes gene_type:complete